MNEKSLKPRIRFKGFTEAWEQRKLNDVATFIDGNYGEKYPKDDEFIDSGIPFLTSAVIGTTGIFNYDLVKYISEEKNSILTKAQSTGGDLILTNRGASMGVSSQIPLHYRMINIGPQLTRIRVINGKADSLFLLNLLNVPYYKEKLTSMNAGSAMPFIGLEGLSKFEFTTPLISEQIILGKLFDKISRLITLHQRK